MELSITFAYMAKKKICISIDECDLARLIAIKDFEKRKSLTNTIESRLDFFGYEFIEVTTKSDGIKYIVSDKFQTSKTYHPR